MSFAESRAVWADVDPATTNAAPEADRSALRMTLVESLAALPGVDLTLVDATTEAEIRVQMREDGYDPDAEIVAED